MARKSYNDKAYEGVDLVIPLKTRADAIKLAQMLLELDAGEMRKAQPIIVRREEAIDRHEGKRLRLRLDTAEEASEQATLWRSDTGAIRDQLTEDDMLELVRERIA